MGALKHGCYSSLQRTPRHTRLVMSFFCASFVASLARAASPDDGGRELEEVIVTAQKRNERIQDVPISISVLSGDQLDKFTASGVTEALNRVPGVVTTVSSQGGGTQVAMRGVTAGGALFNGSSPIAYYLDSVPFGLVKSAIAPDSNAYDMERIEVLRGPQGTLYGASAQNGVVRVLTNDADLQQLEVKTRASLSTTKDGGVNYRGDMALNVPLIKDKLAARAVFGYEGLSGWVDKPNKEDANDAQLRNMRLKINAQPTEQLAIGMSAWLSRNDYGAPSTSDEDFEVLSPADESMEIDYDAFGLKIGYDFSAFSVTSATSYLDYSNEGALDILPLASVSLTLSTALKSKVVAQELILNSTQEGLWRWSVGGMYRDAEDRLIQAGVFLPATIDFGDTSKSFAIFGEVTRLSLDGRFGLTVGLRHFEDEVEQFENIRNTGVPGEPLYRASNDFDADSPRVVLTWHPRDRSTIYASYAEGFRSGFEQNANAPTFPPLKADNLKNYEVGAKGSLAGGRLTYDTAVYYIDWQDVQQTLSVVVGGIPVTALVNGEAADGIGFEFGLSARPVEALALGVNFSWNDLKLTGDTALTTAGVPLFRKGDRLNLSAEYTVGASVDYFFALGGGGYEAHFSTSANYSSEQVVRAVSGPVLINDEGESVLIARASFSLNAPNNWAATLFVDNFTNESSARPSTLGVPDWTQHDRPRTMGFQLEYSFR